MFPVGLGRVISGWDIGIMSMELGEKAELTIASDYGYGDRGSSRGGIPGGATMIFTVELVEIKGKSAPKKEPETKPAPAPEPSPPRSRGPA